MDNERKDFFDDYEKMIDFINMDKEDFLASYSYLTEDEYEATQGLVEKSGESGEYQVTFHILHMILDHFGQGDFFDAITHIFTFGREVFRDDDAFTKAISILADNDKDIFEKSLPIWECARSLSFLSFPHLMRFFRDEATFYEGDIPYSRLKSITEKTVEHIDNYDCVDSYTLHAYLSEEFGMSDTEINALGFGYCTGE